MIGNNGETNREEILYYVLQNLDQWSQKLTIKSIKDHFEILLKHEVPLQERKDQPSTQLYSISQEQQSQPSPHNRNKQACQQFTCENSLGMVSSTIQSNRRLIQSCPSFQQNQMGQLRKLFGQLSQFPDNFKILSRELQMIYDISPKKRLGDQIFSPILGFIQNVTTVQTGKKKYALQTVESFRKHIQDLGYISKYNQKRLNQINNMIAYYVCSLENSIRTFSKKILKGALMANPKDENQMIQVEIPERVEIVAEPVIQYRKYSLSEKGINNSSNELQEQIGRQKEDKKSQKSHQSQESQQSDMSQSLKKNNK